MKRQDNAEVGCGCSRSEGKAGKIANPADNQGCCAGTRATKHEKDAAHHATDQGGCCGGTKAKGAVLNVPVRGGA